MAPETKPSVQLNSLQEDKVAQSIDLKRRFDALKADPKTSPSDKKLYEKWFTHGQFGIRDDLTLSGLTAEEVEDAIKANLEKENKAKS